MTTAVTPKMTTGVITHIKCPHCGQLMDLRKLKETGGLLELGATISCDRCERLSQVTFMQPTILLKLRQVAGRRGDGDKGGRAMPGDGVLRQQQQQQQRIVRRR